MSVSTPVNMKMLSFFFRVVCFSQAHIYYSSIHVSSAHWLANLTQDYITAFLHSCAFRFSAKFRQTRSLSQSNKSRSPGRRACVGQLRNDSWGQTLCHLVVQWPCRHAAQQFTCLVICQTQSMNWRKTGERSASA